MKTIEEIILDYTKGEKDLEETNDALKEAGSNLYLNPDRNKLTEEEYTELIGLLPKKEA